MNRVKSTTKVFKLGLFTLLSRLSVIKLNFFMFDSLYLYL